MQDRVCGVMCPALASLCCFLQSVSDFDWQRQCRLHWSDDETDAVGRGALMVSVCDIDIKYAHEYLGCKERLVITPLTDRYAYDFLRVFPFHTVPSCVADAVTVAVAVVVTVASTSARIQSLTALCVSLTARTSPSRKRCGCIWVAHPWDLPAPARRRQ